VSAPAPSLQAYFTDRLIGQRAASPNTIAAYKLALRLLLAFAAGKTGKAPSALDIADLDAPLITAFPDHLEQDRHNGARSRNNRLAAIHSLFAYLALHHPEHAGSIARVLAIPAKRTERNLVTYLTDPEIDALLGSCDQRTWTGRRDHAMFTLTIQAGLRISELAGLTRHDITLSAGANVHTVGKGRKERRTPLLPTTKAVLKAWLGERPALPATRCFPPGPAPASAETPSSGASPATWPWPAQPARRSRRKVSACTRCVTPRPCACSWLATTSPSSRCGSATSRSPRRTSTCTPT
jgi:site-specific recombinase XerD